MKKVIVIGGGPAGMLAAGFAGKNGNNVILIEKNEKLGKKLFITGKGRCNVTNNTDPEDLINCTRANPYFMYSGFYSFTSQDTMALIESMGTPLKTERGNRVFPVSDKSSDIIKALKHFVEKNGVRVMLNIAVKDITVKDGRVTQVITDKGNLQCDSVIIATGGMSYSVTGSTGDGYSFAEKSGHKIIKPIPSLVPLTIKEKWCSQLMGLSLKNVELTVKLNNKTVYKDMGEMLFTHFGVSGPLILTASTYITGKIDEKPQLYIDLKPALSKKDLDNRLLKDFAKYINKAFKNSLNDLLPQKLIPVIIKLSGIDEDKKVNSITKEERQCLVELIKGLRLNVLGTNGFNEAVITRGGVSVDDIDASTMKSKLVDGMYFAGEVIDVDALTGGFNLQIAFSTGYLAGNNV